MLLLLQAWLGLCIAWSAGGWILSWCGALNRTGYTVVSALYLFWLFFFLRAQPSAGASRWSKLRSRFRSPFPFAFLVLLIVAALGAALNRPTNFDAYSYRIPRVLHWLAEGRWHWIHSADVRLNVVAALFDWLSAPLLLFTRSERSIALINVISFLLLPGLVFSVFWRVNVPKRVAFYFMWVVPAGYCYAMQAGSLANDGFAAVFSLAAVDFALRARASGRWSELMFSLISASLLGAAKQSNFPLYLPWLIALGSSWHLLRQRPVESVAVLVLCGLGSILPTSYYNLVFVGNWKGFRPGHDYTPDSPFWGFVGNAFWIPFSNLLPPIFPFADAWNARMQRFLLSDFGAHFRSFEAFGHTFRAASEQFSGIGFGLSWFLIATAVAVLIRGRGVVEHDSLTKKLVRWTPWLGLAVFMAKVGINQNPRYLAPYYPLLVPALVASPRMREIVRTRWWKALGAAVLWLTILLVAGSRQRPIWPGEPIARALREQFPNKPSLRKIENAYAFPRRLQEGIASIVARIPPSENVVGYAVRFSDKEVFLWKPFGSRRVERINNNDSAKSVRGRIIHYAVVDPSVLVNQGDFVIVDEEPSERTPTMSIERWLQLFNAELIYEQEVPTGPEAPPSKCYLVRFK